MANRNLIADLLIGAAAGAAATWIMDQATTFLYEREPEGVQEREDAARGEKSAYEIAAEKVAALADRELTGDQRKSFASAIHWSLGVSTGIVYGAARNRIPALGLGSGLAYGIAVWLALDEAALTLLGLTPLPRAFPWQAHARGLAGHLVLGAVIESVFDVIDVVEEIAD